MESSIMSLFHLFSGIYSLLLIIVGTPLNLCCFYIFIRLVPNRTNPTIIVFAYLALIELLIPFTWNINYVVRELLWKYQKFNHYKNVEQHSLVVCKLISFGAYFSLQCAAWLKTLATFARCVTLNHHWSLNRQISKPRIIKRISWILIIIVFIINSPIFFVKSEPATVVAANNNSIVHIRCYQSKFFRFWEMVHLLLYNFIPFALMIFFNILLIRQVKSSRQRTQRAKSPSAAPSSSTANQRRGKSTDGGRLTKALFLVNILFIVFTAPAAIFYIVFDGKIQQHRGLITMTLGNLATTSHVTSFLIYWLTSKDFRDATIALFCCRTMNVQRAKAEENQTVRNQQQSSVPLIKQTNEESNTKSSTVTNVKPI